MANDWRRSTWDARAELYNLFVEDRIDDIKLFLEIAQETAGPVLEIGCGFGRVLLPIAERGHQCVGLDFSEKMLARFNETLSQGEGDLKARITLRCENILNAAFEENVFSLVILSYGMLGLLTDDGEAECAIKRAACSLKTGGTLVMERRNRFADRYHTAREFDWIKK